MDKIITVLREKIKQALAWGKEYEKELFVGSVVAFTGALGYGAGLLTLELSHKEPVVVRDASGEIVEGAIPNSTASARESITSENADNQAMSIRQSEVASVAAPRAPSKDVSGLIVGTRSTKKYRLPWCGGISNIAEKNRVYFKTAADAKKAGYTLVKTCKPK